MGWQTGCICRQACKTQVGKKGLSHTRLFSSYTLRVSTPHFHRARYVRLRCLSPLLTPSNLTSKICNRCGEARRPWFSPGRMRRRCCCCFTSTQAHPLFSPGPGGTRSDTLWCACPNGTHTIGYWTPSREEQRWPISLHVYNPQY